MNIDLVQLFLCLCTVIIVVWPAFLKSWKPTIYKEASGSMRFMPPAWIFSVVWTILYGLIAAAEVVHILTVAPTGVSLDVLFVCIVVLYVANISFNHYWGILFFGKRRYVAAFLLTLLILATAIAVCVLYAMTDAWTSFWLYLWYPIWLVVAAILGLRWALHTRKRPTEVRTVMVEPHHSPSTGIPAGTAATATATVIMGRAPATPAQWKSR
jgi:benzodiazapine receptor